MRNLIVFAMMVCVACGGTDGTNNGDTPNGVHGQDPNNGSGSSGGFPNAGTGGNAGSGGSNATGGNGGSAGSSNAGSGGSAGSGGDGGNTGGSAGSGGAGGSTNDDGGMTDDGGMNDASNQGDGFTFPDATVPPDGGSSQDGGTDASDGGTQCNVSCVLTQGYWKTHSSPNWPHTPVLMGDVSYSEQECIALMDTDPSMDASLQLADQFISATENGACAVSGVGLYPSQLGLVMLEAQEWFTTNGTPTPGRLPFGTSVNSVEGQKAVQLAAQLNQFNNGLWGFPACN